MHVVPNELNYERMPKWIFVLTMGNPPAKWIRCSKHFSFFQHRKGQFELPKYIEICDHVILFRYIYLNGAVTCWNCILCWM